MKIAYLILAHENPRHLLRLIGALQSDSAAFFIHLDKTTDTGDFSNLGDDNVHLSQKRIPIYWGDYSLIEATLLLLRKALADPRHFDRFVLLSGADYPLRRATEIECFFRRHPSTEFIDFVQMPELKVGKPIDRLTKFKPRPFTSRFRIRSRKLLVKARVLPRRRDYKKSLRGLTPYAGFQWWALTRDACQLIQAFSERERGILRFLKNTHCPDEMLFQTILGNSPFKSRISRSVTYADWSADGYHPAWIEKRHLEFFRSTTLFEPHSVFGEGEMLFARKFKEENDDLLTALDKIIQESMTWLPDQGMAPGKLVVGSKRDASQFDEVAEKEYVQH